MNNGTNEKSSATIRSDESSGGLLVGMRVDPALSGRRDAMLDPAAISGAQVELVSLAAKLDELSALGDLFDEEEAIAQPAASKAPSEKKSEVIERPANLIVPEPETPEESSIVETDAGFDDLFAEDADGAADVSSDDAGPEDLPTLVPDWARDPSEAFGLEASDLETPESADPGWSVEDDAPIESDEAVGSAIPVEADVEGDASPDGIVLPDAGFSRIEEGEERRNAEVSTRLLDADAVRDLPEEARETFAWEAEDDDLDEDEGRDFFDEELPEAFFDDLPDRDEAEEGDDEDYLPPEDRDLLDEASDDDASEFDADVDDLPDDRPEAAGGREDLHEEDEAWLESVLSEMDDPEAPASPAAPEIPNVAPIEKMDSTEEPDPVDPEPEAISVKNSEDTTPRIATPVLEEDPLAIMMESDDGIPQGDRPASAPHAPVEEPVEPAFAEKFIETFDALNPDGAFGPVADGGRNGDAGDAPPTREDAAKSSAVRSKLLLAGAVIAVTAALGASLWPMLSGGSAVAPVRVAEAPEKPAIAPPVKDVSTNQPDATDVSGAEDDGARADIDALRDLALAPSKPEAVSETAPSPLDDLARGLAGPASGDLSDLLLPEAAPVIEDVAPRVTEEMLEDYAKTEEIAEVRAAIDRMFEEMKGLSNGIMDRDRAIAGLQTEIAAAREQAMRAEALALAQNEVIVDVIRLQEQMVTAEELVVDLSRRLADIEGKDPADRIVVDRELEDLDRRISNLARDVGLVARMSLGGGTARPAAAAAPAAPGSGAVYTRGEADLRPAAANPANVPASVKVGDFVEGYGHVLDVVPTSDGARLVVMENGSVLKP